MTINAKKVVSKSANMNKLIYIKANGIYYRPQEAGVKDQSKRFGNYPVCIIKKLWFGRWQVDLHDEWDAMVKGSTRVGDEDRPNVRMILYPAGIEEIKYM